MFQFYEGTANENTTPRITVRKGGQLVLTRGTVEMLGEGVTHVQLGYDAETQVVGLKSAAEDDKGRYRLRTQGTNGLHLVTRRRARSCNVLGHVCTPGCKPNLGGRSIRLDVRWAIGLPGNLGRLGRAAKPTTARCRG